jgi:hypothetical protein
MTASEGWKREELQRRQAENIQELCEMDENIDWDKQQDLGKQASFLRTQFGKLRVEMDDAPGEAARGIILLALSVLLAGAETIEEHYAERLMERK